MAIFPNFNQQNPALAANRDLEMLAPEKVFNSAYNKLSSGLSSPKLHPQHESFKKGFNPNGDNFNAYFNSGRRAVLNGPKESSQSANLEVEKRVVQAAARQMVPIPRRHNPQRMSMPSAGG